MRAFIATLAAVVCVVFLAAGNFYWKEKTNISSFTGNVQSVENEIETTKEPVEINTVDLKVLDYAKKWPEEAQELFHSALDKGEEYKIAIVGSQALGGYDGWANMLKEDLEETYGETSLKVIPFQYDDINSDQFILDGHMEEVTAAKPDLILFEPFTLNDNGKVKVEEGLHNIETFIDAMREANSRAVVILQPTHPIYHGPNYTIQVEQLNEFAKKNDIAYLDHWTAWPDRMIETEIRKYVPKGGGAPNEKGHELWFEYLREYFVSE